VNNSQGVRGLKGKAREVDSERVAEDPRFERAYSVTNEHSATITSIDCTITSQREAGRNETYKAASEGSRHHSQLNVLTTMRLAGPADTGQAGQHLAAARDSAHCTLPLVHRSIRNRPAAAASHAHARHLMVCLCYCCCKREADGSGSVDRNQRRTIHAEVKPRSMTLLHRTSTV